MPEANRSRPHRSTGRNAEARSRRSPPPPDARCVLPPRHRAVFRRNSSTGSCRAHSCKEPGERHNSLRPAGRHVAGRSRRHFRWPAGSPSRCSKCRSHSSRRRGGATRSGTGRVSGERRAPPFRWDRPRRQRDRAERIGQILCQLGSALCLLDCLDGMDCKLLPIRRRCRIAWVKIADVTKQSREGL